MSAQKSRTERLLEKRYDPNGPISDELGEEKAKEWWKNAADRIVESENQDFWTLYRALDGVSQSDVKALVEPSVDVSQSSVSRVIRQKEDAVVHDSDALSSLHGYYEEETVDVLPEELLEAYRQAIAEAYADLLALKEIHGPTTQTPEWAARRFPELVGCHHYVADQTGEEDDIVDDSHLNRLDSVNTERWK